MSVFALVISAPRVKVVEIFAGLDLVFHDLFVSPFCLYDESEHFALRRLYHSFVFIGGCPCSRCVAYRLSYRCVEQPETMFEHVVFRCQLLPVLVERRPSYPDSILGFGRLLLQERNRLAQVSHAFSSCVRGVNCAKAQDSSVGGGAVVNCLGVVHMEEEVQDRVQREERRVGETHGKEQGEEQRVKEQTLNRSSWMSMEMT